MSENTGLESIRAVFEERLNYISGLAERKYEELVSYIASMVPYECGVSKSNKQGWVYVSYSKKFKQPVPVGALKPYSVEYTPPKVDVKAPKIDLPPLEIAPQVGEIKGITDIPKPEKVSVNLSTLKRISIPDINVPVIPTRQDFSSKAVWDGLQLTAAIAAAIGYNPYAWWDPLLGAKAIAVGACAATAYKVGEMINNLWDNYIKPVFEKINGVIGDPNKPPSYSINWAFDEVKNQVEGAINSVIGDPSSPSNGTINYLIKYGVGVPADSPPERSLNWVLAKLHSDVATPLYNFGIDVKREMQNLANSLVDKMNSLATSLRDNTQKAINEVSVNMSRMTETAVNTGIKKVYDLMGLMWGMGMAPAIIKGGDGGFEWWSPKEGVELMYIVVDAGI